jgi:hypothetical protein
LRYKCKFPIEAGVAVCKQMQSCLKTEAFRCNLDIDIESMGGFLVRSYGVTVHGEEEDVKKFIANAEVALGQYDTEG